MRKRVFYIAAFLAMLFAATSYGAEAEDFTLKDIEGEQHTLSSYRGRVVFLNFWATWCRECRKEMPALNNLYSSLKDKGFVMLGISIDRKASKVREFLKETPVEFATLLDPEGDVYIKKYTAVALPTSFLIDKDGQVVESYFGPRAWDSPSYRAKVQKLLNR